jgi:hypothetical protein
MKVMPPNEGDAAPVGVTLNGLGVGQRGAAGARAHNAAGLAREERGVSQVKVHHVQAGRRVGLVANAIVLQVECAPHALLLWQLHQLEDVSDAARGIGLAGEGVHAQRRDDPVWIVVPVAVALGEEKPASLSTK